MEGIMQEDKKIKIKIKKLQVKYERFDPISEERKIVRLKDESGIR